ncbi:Dephospho-CoA kinase [Tieghemiomyces parasiticus]|uniref:Dephospho-CoA kinase n=1 Tax=Tieghemiomyces parasiticus TaxID=78921 RepID=A0A9W8DZI1_9FUNG|nr:Dephospho-CoA kinase [Tieghemiomyces parasiticus]
MKVIGLTGGIATGKSTVTATFREAGIPIVDADLIARQVVEPGQPAHRAIAQHFGPDVFLPNGTLDRPRLGQIIFADETQRRVLNGITHPAVRRRMLREVLCHYLHGSPLVVLDVPLLFESQLDRFVSATVVVYCDEATQLARLMGRDGFDETTARQRMAAQMDMEAKCARADIVIDNTGDRAATRVQVLRLIKRLTPGTLATILAVVLPVGGAFFTGAFLVRLLFGLLRRLTG